MLTIPLLAAPSQTLNVRLGGQQCNLRIYTLATGLHIDVAVDNAPVCSCIPCFNLNKIIGLKYLGFIGDLMFEDTQGLTDPVYTGLGARYQLRYVEA